VTVNGPAAPDSDTLFLDEMGEIGGLPPGVGRLQAQADRDGTV
jgi:hypothetical protein